MKTYPEAVVGIGGADHRAPRQGGWRCGGGGESTLTHPGPLNAQRPVAEARSLAGGRLP